MSLIRVLHLTSTADDLEHISASATSQHSLMSICCDVDDALWTTLHFHESLRSRLARESFGPQLSTAVWGFGVRHHHTGTYISIGSGCTRRPQHMTLNFALQRVLVLMVSVNHLCLILVWFSSAGAPQPSRLQSRSDIAPVSANKSPLRSTDRLQRRKGLPDVTLPHEVCITGIFLFVAECFIRVL